MIRKAKPQDADAIADLAVESVSINPFPVRLDRESMREEALKAMEPAHFMWVSEIDGEVVAALGAQVHTSFWFRGKACSVMLLYTRVPGESIKLLREFARWVKGRTGIKTCTFELEAEADPRLARLLNRLGFTRQSLNMTFVRGSNEGS